MAKRRAKKHPIPPSDDAFNALPQRATRGPYVSRRAALAAGLGIVGFGAYALSSPPIARAVDENGFPTWDEVEAARANEAAKGNEISKINGIIGDLEQRVADAQAVARQAGDEYYAAQQAFQNQQRIADDLDEAARRQSAAADSASTRAAQAANQLYRNGGGGSKALELFFNGSPDASDALTDLGRIERVVAQNQTLYDSALAARNTATQLGQQAQVAAQERDRLKQEAEAAWQRAQQAADEAQQALWDQRMHLITLEAQLEALQDTTSKTIADFQAGVAFREEQERKRREEEERLRREAEQKRLEAERKQREWEAEQARIRKEERDRLDEEARLLAIQQEEERLAEEKRQAEAQAEAERLAEIKRREDELAEEKRLAEIAAEEERRRREEEERRRREEEAANNPPPAPTPEPAPPITSPPANPDGWAHPLPGGWVTSSYGPRASIWTSGGWTKPFHYGTDFVATPRCGSAIAAAHSGTVKYASWSGGFGYHVIIDHHNGWATSYSHIVEDGINVWQGQWVEAGDTIAWVGTTGQSTGCHLHFEVYQGGPGGATVNPAEFLSEVGVWV